ncbi:MAG: hypothetical protein VW270_02960 [Candidatus Poseidoniales archaeon]
MNLSEIFLEFANQRMNVEVKYNTYVGDPRKVVPLENMNQAVDLVLKNNRKTKSQDEVRKELTNLAAIATCVNKESKKTSAMVTLKRADNDSRKEAFEKAGISELADEYLFELGNIEVAEEERGKGLAHHLTNRLLGQRSGRGATIYCSTESEEVANMLMGFRFERLGKNEGKPFLLGLM